MLRRSYLTPRNDTKIIINYQIKEKVKISIITASYNYADYIEDVINSVINQTYENWELIIVDDGSSDSSVEIIKSYCDKDERIKLFLHEGSQNKGLKETLLLGVEKSTGDWVAFLESDDFFKPDNLLKKVEVIEKNPSVKLVFNKVEFFGDEKRSKKLEKDLSPTQNELSKMIFPRNMFYDFYTKNMILTFSSVMVEKEALLNTDFNAPVEALLDWWLWIHLAYKNEFYYVDEVLTSWNLHPQSYISTSKKPILPTQIKAYFDVYKNNGKNFTVLLFILFSMPKLFIIRIKKILKKVINKLIPAS